MQVSLDFKDRHGFILGRATRINCGIAKALARCGG